jgi:predicted Zn-dependent peptidase
MKFKKSTLDNGLRILTEHHPESRCTVMGVWVTTGTRHETPEMLGVSHLIEHMVFKGTERHKSAYDLARVLEAVGGEINAYTGREYTCYHTTTLKENLDLSVDVLSQLVKSATFNPDEFEKERRVILQEILMAADDTEEYIYDLFFESIYAGNSLGWPILGTLDSIKNIRCKDAQSWYQQRYYPQNMIVSAAGAIDHDDFVAMIEKELGGQWGAKPFEQQIITPPVRKINEFVQKDTEQYHLIGSFPASSYHDDNRFDAYVLNTALGGGMTSRLYQKIREERGLVYSIFSLLNTFTDNGIQTIYAGTEKENVGEVIDLIVEELFGLTQVPISKEDVDMFKVQARAQIIMAAEDIESRMNSLAVNEMVFGKYRPVDQVVAEIDRVSVDSVDAFVKEKINPENLSFFMMGPEGLDFE